MTIALIEDHRALADVARAFLSERNALTSARERLDQRSDELPGFWSELAALGWLGLHLPESHGGQGYGLAELAVVLHEMGRVVAPGPFLPTAWASAVIAAAGSEAQQARWLPDLAGGTVRGAVGLSDLVLGARMADLFLVVQGDDVVVVERDAGVEVGPPVGLDETRWSARVSLPAGGEVLLGAAGVARELGLLLSAAESAGGARSCTDAAVEYAKIRQQFGRPIGSFQAVKHHAANMLVATELAEAAVWDAARAADEPGAPERAYSVGVAAVAALIGFRRNAEASIQLHGGIGYTWEHDAHLYLKRAAQMAALFAVDTDVAASLGRAAASGAGRRVVLELPAEAEQFRQEVREFRQRYDRLADSERRSAYVDSGYAVPHWPKPYGRAAGAAEQLVIDEELDGLPGLGLGIGGWVLLTITQHGTPDQIDRWVRPSLMGDLQWCQLFSEPNAGSDAAAISTRGVRVDGGWLVNGQKVWTSGAQNCNRGLATVRTDPAAPKHAGITTMAIDLTAKGVEVRPLREITGEAMFNEVFFDDVFVPDDDVVGPVDSGWTVARATLGNERVSIGRGSDGGIDYVPASAVGELAVHSGREDRLAEVGVLVAEGQSMALLNLRHVLRSLIGGPPGPEGNIAKLLSAEHAQRVAGLGMIVGASSVAGGGDPRITYHYIFSRCLTIAGGTSEIVRNVIAERLLGLPREPNLK